MYFAFSAVLFAAATAAPTAPIEKKPHLVYILIDDLGFNDFSYRSSDLEGIAWKNVNSMLNGSIKIDTFYTQHICTPTRGALLSGRYPVRLGLQHDVIQGFQDYGLPLDEVTLADKLNAAGYRSYIVGKWHLGCYNFASTPTHRGFETFYGYWNGMEDYYAHEIGGLRDLHKQNGSSYEDIDSESGQYSTPLFADLTVAGILGHKEAHPEQPGFFYVPMQNVHAPLEAPDEYVQKCASIPDSDRRTFCAMAYVADEAIGNITRAVAQAFRDELYLVVISGDNGGMPMSAGNNMPLRGHKAELWEGGVRNNAIAWGSLVPEKARGSNYEGGLVHVMDWHATFLELAGATLSPKAPIDGVSVWRAITENMRSPRSELLHNYDPCSGGGPHATSCQGVEYAYRMGDWKLLCGVRNDTYYPLPDGSSTSDSLSAKPVVHMDAASGSVWWDHYQGVSGILPNDDSPSSCQLYNITADPTEATDLFAEHPKVARKIAQRVSVIVNGSDYMPPCNIPGGSCYDDDENGATVTQAKGAWYPWVT